MIHFLKSGSRPRKAPQAVLGLSWEGRRIEGTLLRRTPAGLQKVAEFQAELSVELDSGDPETIGKELRARLDEAGIRERTCAVALSVSSLLVTQTEIPPLADADAHSLLQLEAEKGFHADASSLQVAYSRCVRGGGDHWVTLAALPQTRLASLERWMRAARLRLVSVSSGIGELQPPAEPSSEGVIALSLGSGPGPVTLHPAVLRGHHRSPFGPDPLGCRGRGPRTPDHARSAARTLEHLGSGGPCLRAPVVGRASGRTPVGPPGGCRIPDPHAGA
ncbi:MAG: hypothetical protein EBU81_00440 [Proteobacteria bacterium]|nr:hypothetical protein [Pseudomonadota bacterium]